MEEEKTTYSRTNIIVGSILAAAVIGIIVLSILTYINSTSDKEDIGTLYSKSVSLENQLSDAESKLALLSSQLADANSRIDTLNSQESSDVASLQSGLSSATEQITSLSNQVGSVLSQLSSLQAEVSYDASNIATLQSQLSAINTQLTSLGNTTASLQDTLTSLGNTVNSLVTQVNSLKTQVTSPVILFSSQPVSQTFGTQTLLATFTPTYNGSVYISGNSSSTTGYIRVTNNSTAAYVDYAFGTGTTIAAPVTAGYSYSIRFGNTEAAGTVTATLSGTYYPSATGTHTAALFTSKPVSQNPSTQTLLYTYTPPYNGYFYIFGNSSSTTGYIRVNNNSTATYTDYAFGTGTTVTAGVTAGYNYSIRFGNTEAAGTVTATLSATYNY